MGAISVVLVLSVRKPNPPSFSKKPRHTRSLSPLGSFAITKLGGSDKNAPYSHLSLGLHRLGPMSVATAVFLKGGYVKNVIQFSILSDGWAVGL